MLIHIPDDVPVIDIVRGLVEAGLAVERHQVREGILFTRRVPATPATALAQCPTARRILGARLTGA